MEKQYQTDKGRYNVNLAEMTVDERLSRQPEGFTPMGCQCKSYPCRECRNRINPSLDELDELEVERIFSELLAA